MTKKPILLCILDGWGIGDDSDAHNSIARANLPNYKNLLAKYPHSQLETSGLAVGLPEGQMGNSEVGHMTIGAGRVVFQDLPRINNAIFDGNLEKNQELQKLIFDLKTSKKVCHLMGLFSDGGVHSHIDHIIYLANFLNKSGVKTLLHAFLDGRDVAQKSALEYLKKINPSQAINHSPQTQIGEEIAVATISGRYYSMDRDKNWNRVKLAYDAIAFGKGEKAKDAASAINNSYQNSITDEFVLPTVLGDYQGIEDGDAMIFCNFRADRAREISEAILDNNFKEFETKKINFSHALALTEYSEKLNQFYKVLFPAIEIKNSLPEILAVNNFKQLRIAETEKYAHVTFFFSCGYEKEMLGEKRILVKSPAVATYDLKPEMSAFEVGEKLMTAIKSDEFDFIIVNYANPDMVGHSGMLDPSIKACEAIDKQLALLSNLILEKDGYMLISADHGNIECMIDENHQPHTSHTTNPVPFILIGKNVSDFKLENGALSDIAPTILHLMNIAKPTDMTGKNLIK
jgi:2,3-bisphosphoglycerate-independent phosphoglycerate mutase